MKKPILAFDSMITSFCHSLASGKSTLGYFALHLNAPASLASGKSTLRYFALHLNAPASLAASFVSQRSVQLITCKPSTI
jgi:hypothetical protein